MSMAVKYSWSLNNIDNLSDEVLGEIFIRLPLISIAKCKCVCKRWLELISTCSFPRQFISHQRSLFKAYITFLSPHQLMFSFSPPNLNLDVQTQKALLSLGMLIKENVCGYSNGLFLCSNNRYTRGRGYFVYNPLTMECTRILPSPRAGREESMYAIGFLSETYDSTRCFWLVLVKSFIVRKHKFEVEVFYSETGAWRQIVVNCENGFAFAPHWMLSLAHRGSLYFMGRTSIFVFDPICEYCLHTIDYPEDVDAMNIISFGYLGCSGGTLRIADIGPNELRVWKLMYPKTWHLVHSINLTTYLPKEFCGNYYKCVGGFHLYDEDIVYLYSYVDGVYIANLRTNKFEFIPSYDKLDISPFQLELPFPPSNRHGKTHDPSDHYELHAYYFSLETLGKSHDIHHVEEPEDI